MAFARVLSGLRRLLQMCLCSPVFCAAVGIKHSQVGAFGLLLRPPLQQAGTFTPALDDAVSIHQKDGVVPDVLGNQRVDEVRVQTFDFGRAQLLGRSGLSACKGSLPFTSLRAPIAGIVGSVLFRETMMRGAWRTRLNFSTVPDQHKRCRPLPRDRLIPLSRGVHALRFLHFHA